MTPERIAELERLEKALAPLVAEAQNKSYEFGFDQGVRAVYSRILRWAAEEKDGKLRTERFEQTETARKLMEEWYGKTLDV